MTLSWLFVLSFQSLHIQKTWKLVPSTLIGFSTTWPEGATLLGWPKSIYSTSSDCTVVSDEKIPQALIATEPEPIQMDEFESDSDSDYDETESEETVEPRNAITRSAGQIKASVRFDLWWESF